MGPDPNLVPQPKEPMSVPSCAGDGEGDGRQAVEGSAVPGKAVSHHHGPLRPSIPFAHQNGTDPEVGPALRQFSRQSSSLHPAAAAKLFEKPDCIGGEIAKLVGQQPIDQNAE